MSRDWQMPRSSFACVLGDRAFEPGEEFRTYLFASRDGYERRDYCLTCLPPDESAAVGSWKTRRPLPAERRAPTFDREAIYGLFQSLEDAQRREQREFRFVLALVLWRRRVIRFVSSAEELQGEVWRFTGPGEAEHRVERPMLDEDRIQKLSVELEELLSGGRLPAALASTANEPGEQSDA
jgi:hypothetical protein